MLFTCNEFLDKVLRDGFDCDELGKALAHFCYKNEKFSKRVAKMIVKGINRNDYDVVKHYLETVIQISQVND